MAKENKTTENKNSVAGFIKSVPDEQKQKDAFALVEIIKKQSGFDAKMWGTAIIGFGSYHYKYESGREGDAPLVGFSPRKNEFALYIPNFEKKDELLKQFGKHKTAKSCVYIKKVEDINIEILKKMVTHSISYLKAKYK
jgi:hypothetical protein